MQVIGVAGRNGSGKDELLKYLRQRCDLVLLSSGNVARQIAEEKGVAATRENLHRISQEYIERHGQQYFMRRLIDQIREEWNAVGITGIRSPADVGVLRGQFGDDFLLVRVEVGDPRLRFERVRERGKERDPQSYQEFLRQDEEEAELFDLDETLQQADLTIRNDASLQAFHRRIRESIVESPLGDALHCDGAPSEAGDRGTLLSSR